jgi:hypothetical protein
MSGKIFAFLQKLKTSEYGISFDRVWVEKIRFNFVRFASNSKLSAVEGSTILIKLLVDRLQEQFGPSIIKTRNKALLASAHNLRSLGVKFENVKC